MEAPGAAAAREAAQAARGEARAANAEAAPISREQVQREIARSVLSAFGLRPFHVFDGERYHVCFAVAKELVVDDVDYGVEVLEDFFSNCGRASTVSNAHEGVFPRPWTPPRTPSAAVPALVAKEEGPSAQLRENDCISARSPSPREVHYIMEEHYLSASPTPREIAQNVDNDPVLENQPTVENQPVLENQPAAENQPVVVETDHHVHFINPRTLKEIHFVMEDNYLSPEELRLSICFPLLLAPPAQPDDALPSAPNDVLVDEPQPREAGPSIQCAGGENVVPSNDCGNDGNAVEASTRSNAGKVKDLKSNRPKKKKGKVVEEFDASQSVRPDKPWTVKPSVRKRKHSQKKATKEYSEEWAEPPWNGLNVGDLEEQTGDSWVEGERRRGLLEENPGDVVNPGQPKKSFWPTPLYGSPGRSVKAPPSLIEKDIHSPTFAGSDEDSSEVEDFEESVEQSMKREEVALAKYALLFKDDQSWRKKFLDGFKLTCDICFSKRGSSTFSDIYELVTHAQHSQVQSKRIDHMGFRKALIDVLKLDIKEPAANINVQAEDDSVVWPPIVVVENTRTGMGADRRWEGVTNSEMAVLLNELGHLNGRAKSVWDKFGHRGLVHVEYEPTLEGLQEAERLHNYFLQSGHGRVQWDIIRPFKVGLPGFDTVPEGPDFTRFDEASKTTRRVLYGYLALKKDIEKIFSKKQRKKVQVANRKDVTAKLLANPCGEGVI